MAVVVVALATALALTVSSSGNVAKLIATQDRGSELIFGETLTRSWTATPAQYGAMTPDDLQFAALSNVWCKANQVVISMTTSRSSSPSQAGWSGTLWFRNTAKSCLLRMTNIGMQAVSGANQRAVGGSSVSSAMGYLPFLFHAGHSASAAAVIEPTNVKDPTNAHGTIASNCAARDATGIVLLGYQRAWPDEYFRLLHPVSVCTKGFVNIAGGLLTPTNLSRG